MAVRVTFTPPEQLDLVKEISRVSNQQSELTPRSQKSLAQAALKGNLAQIYESEKLIGWALVEPLTKNLAEIGLVYIDPKFRSASTFNLLMKLVASRPERMLLATYDKDLIRYVRTVWRAKEITLWKAITLSRGKFLGKRMNLASLRAIGRKVKRSKPLIAVVGERN
ncbi:MAG: hypothetical protein ACKOFA_03765 [Rhodoluna sp.]